jgi:hypothetical protein
MERLLTLLAVAASCASATTYYISPSGSDFNDGLDRGRPFKTFTKVFKNASMIGGDTLILLSGIYLHNTTGVIGEWPEKYIFYSNYSGGPSAAPPDGIDRDHMTRIVADVDGGAVLVGRGLNGYDSMYAPPNGCGGAALGTGSHDCVEKSGRALRLGHAGGSTGVDGKPTAYHRAQYIYFQGIQFVNGGALLWPASYIYLKNCGFEDHNGDGTGGYWLIGVGRNSALPGSSQTLAGYQALRSDHILIEDSWTAGAYRGAIITAVSDSVVMRRNVNRQECKPKSYGCEVAGMGDAPWISNTFYHANNNSYQNFFSYDSLAQVNVRQPGKPAGRTALYCDFCTANHLNDYTSTTIRVPHGRNEVLGSGSLNVIQRCGEWDPDIIDTLAPVMVVKDFVCLNPAMAPIDIPSSTYPGIDIALDHTTGTNAYGVPNASMDDPDPTRPQMLLDGLTLILSDPANASVPSLRLQNTSTNLMTRWSLHNILTYSPLTGHAGWSTPPYVYNPYQANALDSGFQVSGASMYGSFWQSSSGSRNRPQDVCGGPGPCFAQVDPTGSNPIALRSILRVEPGSFLSGTGIGGRDIGADITKRYGCDGCWYGDPGYNDKTAVDLWPLPMESRILAESCTDWSEYSYGSADPLWQPAGAGPAHAVVRLTRYGHASPDLSFCASGVTSLTDYTKNLFVPAATATCSITSNSPLARAVIGTPYSATLLLSSACPAGGTWSGWTTCGGLALDGATGVISGAPSGSPQTCTSVVTYTSGSTTASKSLSVTIGNPPSPPATFPIRHKGRAAAGSTPAK